MTLFTRIPPALRNLHEEGKVVFFCGAGVSKAAGLPTFWEMVEKVVKKLVGDHKLNPSDPAWKALIENKLDEALDILERDTMLGHGSRMREEVRRQLSKRPRNLDAHVSLCRLAGLDTNQGRLVTTNQETLFEKGIRKLQRASKSKIKKHVDIAPSLPPPKEKPWHSLTYMHGRLDNPADSGGDQNLVLTTADFGSAYLVDRWASKFVTELFRNFTVVFIGYSIDDPTMNYMVRALAAERDSNPGGYNRAHAFAPFGGDSPHATSNEALEIWDRKGVTAIPYDSADKHQELWDGLKLWADLHCGLDARRRIASELGRHEPIGTQVVDREMMTWALTDKEGDTAKLFGDTLSEGEETAPVLHIKWLPILDEIGLLSLPDGEKVPLVSHVLQDRLPLHPVTNQLGRWIAKNIHEPDVLEWALKRGGILHESLRRYIRGALADDKRKEHPDIPEGMAKVWSQLVQRGYAYQLARKTHWPDGEDLRVDPDKTQSLQAFLDRLEPIPIFKPSFNWEGSSRPTPDPAKATSYCDMTIHLLGVEEVYDLEGIMDAAIDWDAALAKVAEDLTTLLASAMAWQEAFNKASPTEDDTYIEYRSISEHEQNEHAKTWTILITLVRDAFEALAARDPAAAVRLVHRWNSLGYPVFKRLVLHAVTGGRDA